MTDTKDWQRAYALVGQFMCMWAMLESGLNEIIKGAFKLDVTQGFIVTANISVRDKIFICRTIAHASVHKPQAWRDMADTILKKVELVARDRNIVAHTMYGPDEETDGVSFLRILAKGKLAVPKVVWSKAEFEAKFDAMLNLRSSLQEIEDGFRRDHRLSDADFWSDILADDSFATGSETPSTTRLGTGLLSAALRQRQNNQTHPSPTPESDDQTRPETPARSAARRPPAKPKAKTRSKKGAK